MANPTTNYSFAMPTNTDLVKDLPADFEVFGQAVDTQMKTNADAATQKATLTTTGDIYYASSASTPARLGIGSANQVLTVNGSGLPAWTTPAGGTANFLLLNSGGTALTGSQTITISGITSKKLYAYVIGASSASNYPFIGFRFNGNTGSVYQNSGYYNTVSQSFPTKVNATETNANFARAGVASTTNTGGSIMVEGCDSSTGVKPYSMVGIGDEAAFSIQGIFTSTTAITSISVFSDLGNFDAGTVYVYGSSN